jgi:hypothetical protein
MGKWTALDEQPASEGVKNYIDCLQEGELFGFLKIYPHLGFYRLTSETQFAVELGSCVKEKLVSVMIAIETINTRECLPLDLYGSK